MNIQRLRNLTTGRLHTEMVDVYEDIEYLTGHNFFTHHLPNASRAMDSWLRAAVPDQRFWDGELDTSHTGTIEVKPMTGDERIEFFKRFEKLPNPFYGKVICRVESP